MATKDKREFVYKSTLKTEFFLTDKLIRELGEPDKYGENPHYKSGPPTSLYSLKRVKDFCRRHRRTVADVKAKRGKRSEPAEKAVATKTEKLVEEVSQIKLEFGKLPKSLNSLTSGAYGYAVERYGVEAHQPGESGVIAYARHNYTNYESILSVIRGRIGNDAAYMRLRNKLDEELVEHLRKTYPDWDSEFARC